MVKSCYFDVKLETQKEISDFCEQTLNMSAVYLITAGHGNYTVDGHSVMGILSLNLSEPIRITISRKDNTPMSEKEQDGLHEFISERFYDFMTENSAGYKVVKFVEDNQS